MFTAVYHEYIPRSVWGRLSPASSEDRRNSIPTMPQRPSPDAISPPSSARIARGMMWGRQLALSQFSPLQGREEQNRKKLAFVAAALRAQTWGIGATLTSSEFLGVLPVEAPTIEADFSSAASTGPGRGGVARGAPSLLSCPRRRVRVPGGGNALIMANLHDHPVEFTAKLNSTRTVLNLPLSLAGRTFSEDGDAPAATLRGTGTQVGGKLPGRCIVLVTLFR